MTYDDESTGQFMTYDDESTGQFMTYDSPGQPGLNQHK
jgi:hypothetical protein